MEGSDSLMGLASAGCEAAPQLTAHPQSVAPSMLVRGDPAKQSERESSVSVGPARSFWNCGGFLHSPKNQKQADGGATPPTEGTSCWGLEMAFCEFEDEFWQVWSISNQITNNKQ